MSSLDTQIWKLRFDWAKSPAAARVLCLAIARRSFSTGRYYASQGTLAELTDLSAKTVKRQLDELEEHGWVGREPNFRPDGSRSVDAIWLTLPEVILEATSITKQGSADAVSAMDIMTHGPATVSPPAQEGEVGSGQEGQSDPPIVSGAFLRPESRPLDSRPRRQKPTASEADLDIAVGMIWEKGSKAGRERSSKADVKIAMRAAVARGHALEAIVQGYGGYFATDTATKPDRDTGEEGAYQMGLHRLLERDRFLSFIPDAPREPKTDAERTARDMVGVEGKPGDDLQRLWMQLFTTGMAWNPERGPEPGRLGCRVDPAIQRAYGVEPFGLAAAATDDAGAFD